MPYTFPFYDGLQGGIRVGTEVISRYDDCVNIVEDRERFNVYLTIRPKKREVARAGNYCAKLDRRGKCEEELVDAEAEFNGKAVEKRTDRHFRQSNVLPGRVVVCHVKENVIKKEVNDVEI